MKIERKGGRGWGKEGKEIDEREVSFEDPSTRASRCSIEYGGKTYEAPMTMVGYPCCLKERRGEEERKDVSSLSISISQSREQLKLTCSS